MHAEKSELMLLAMLLIAAFLLRAWQVDADPPQDLTFSNGPFSDPGLRSFDARNLSLFGQANIFPEEERPTYMMSVPLTGLLTVTFLLFGTGYVQMRLVSVFFGLLSIALFYFLARSLSGKRIAFLSAAFLAFSYSTIFFDRFAFLETFMATFLILSLLLWQKSNLSKKQLALRLASLASFALAFLFKPLAFLFIPVLGIAFLFSKKNAVKKPGWSQGTGLALLLAVFLVLVYALTPNFFDLSGSSIPTRFAVSPLEVARNLGLFFANSFFAQNLLVSLVAAIGLLFAAREFIQRRFSADQGKTLMASWLLCGAIPIAFLSYQPPRYFLFILPPVCFLAASLLLQFLNTASFHPKAFSQRLASIATLAWLAAFSFAASIWLNKFFFDVESLGLKLANIALTAAAFFVALPLAFFLVTRKTPPFSIPAKARQAVFALALMAFIASSLLPFLFWSQAPEFTLPTTSRQLALDVPKDSIVLGFPATWLCLETRLKCVPLYPNFNDESPLETFGPTHLLVTEGIDDEVLERNYGNWRSLVEFVKEYAVGKETISLYKVR